uniref:Uncharacterized protein n=1 Tax=Labrus bergylta TaxID=56723 RepID=A0A3Q3GW56_9LABR
MSQSEEKKHSRCDGVLLWTIPTTPLLASALVVQILCKNNIHGVGPHLKKLNSSSLCW